MKKKFALLLLFAMLSIFILNLGQVNKGITVGADPNDKNIPIDAHMVSGKKTA